MRLVRILPGVVLPEGMRGGEQAAAAAKPKKEDGAKSSPPLGEKEILARIKDQAGLRQRRTKAPVHAHDGRIGPGEADANTTRSDAGSVLLLCAGRRMCPENCGVDWCAVI